MRIYECGHCHYKGPAYGAATDQGVTAPWCPRCERNDKLKEVKEKEE